jgi:hypothetical protein
MDVGEAGGAHPYLDFMGVGMGVGMDVDVDVHVHMPILEYLPSDKRPGYDHWEQ